jgi:aspartate/glutamate racemase
VINQRLIKKELQPILKIGEKIPTEVLRCAEELLSLGIWHQFSRNPRVMSCQDAAQKRNRLGHIGIPLWDELKSFLGEYEDSAGNRKLFLAHYRGDREVDLQKLKEILNSESEVDRLKATEDSGDVYGIVNPFMVSDGTLQIFDYELHRTIGVPGTIMTNAGEHTWAVEFDPLELVLKLRGAIWANIVKSEEHLGASIVTERREPKTIGILTGNPSDSGIYLWEAINHHLRLLMGKNSLGDISMPKVIMVSTPQIGISMEMAERESPLRKEIIKAVDELCDAGANIIVHPAHTTHYFAEDIAEHSAKRGAQFISMATVTIERLKAKRINEVSLLGTRYVTDFTQKWSVYANAFSGIKTHCPSIKGWEKIHEIGYEIQQNGLTPRCFNWLRDLLRDEVPESCKYVLLAMTEFTSISKHIHPKSRVLHGKILIDPIDLYGEEIARQYLGLTRA